MRKISPSDLLLSRPAQPSDSVAPSPATPTTPIGRLDERLTSAPIESVRCIGGARRSSTEPDPCPYAFCDGSGWYKEAVPFGQLLPCACRLDGEAQRRAEEQRQRLARFEDEMGGELAAATLDNYDLGRAHNAAARKLMAEARDACRAYVDQPRGWIFLYGPTGVGKSHLAAATARAIARQHDVTLAYISEPELLKYLREGWGKQGDESEDARITLLQHVDLLVIDDMYTEHRGKGESTWVDSKLVALTMPRYQHERLTIITSNVQVDDVDEPRLRSRIKGRTNPDYAGRSQCLLIRNADQREGGRR